MRATLIEYLMIPPPLEMHDQQHLGLLSKKMLPDLTVDLIE